MSARLDVHRLARELPLAGVEFHEEIGSTNDRALALVRGEAAISGESLKTPLLVLAESQTAGRGRRAKDWWSAPGALTFSLILGPEMGRILESASSQQLSLAAAGAVRDALRALLPGTAVALKPPNDVLIGGKKVCGILIESPAVVPRRCVVGVGLNVNNSTGSAPAEIASLAVALADAAGRPLDRTQVLIAVVRELLSAIARQNSLVV